MASGNETSHEQFSKIFHFLIHHVKHICNISVETLGEPPDVDRKWSLSTAEHSDAYEGRCFLSYAIDSNHDTNYERCYHASDKKSKLTYAMFWVEPGYLHSVWLLNRGDCLSCG